MPVPMLKVTYRLLQEPTPVLTDSVPAFCDIIDVDTNKYTVLELIKNNANFAKSSLRLTTLLILVVLTDY